MKKKTLKDNIIKSHALRHSKGAFFTRLPETHQKAWPHQPHAASFLHHAFNLLTSPPPSRQTSANTFIIIIMNIYHHHLRLSLHAKFTNTTSSIVNANHPHQHQFHLDSFIAQSNIVLFF